MRTNLFLLGATMIALAFATLVSGQDPAAKADPSEGASYIGAAKCKKCHMKQHRSWRKMKHKAAWDVLDDKYKGADAKDDSGRACVSCHVTGYGQKDRAGFVDAENSSHLLGVQCEVCHGPGSNHAAAGKKVLDEKRKKFNDGEKNFISRTGAQCANCHNPHISHKKYAKGG